MKTCFLQITPEIPDPVHVAMCENHNDCDLYFVTHDVENADAIRFCPNTNWAQTRNILVKDVPKKYDYYCFVDYDYQLVSRTHRTFIDQMIFDLERFNYPPIMIPFPGTGLATHLSQNTKYLDSREYSIHMFTHCGMKIIHKSLLDWFFPMVEKFDGGWSAAHYFNLMEIPFYRDLIVSHNILYNHCVFGGTSDKNSHRNMSSMWEWFKKSIKLDEFERFDSKFNPPFRFRTLMEEKDALKIKKYFIEFYQQSKFKPRDGVSGNYLDLDYLSKFFDFDHENFSKLKSIKNSGTYR